MKKLTIALLLGSLAACTTYEERFAGWQQECAAFGYQPETVEFANCLQAQDAQYEAANAAATAAILSANQTHSVYGY